MPYSSRYRSRRKPQHYDSHEIARRHIEEAKQLLSKYGPAFEQIKELFLDLDDDRFDRLLSAYGNRHGHTLCVNII
jgi:hypothetical protein